MIFIYLGRNIKIIILETANIAQELSKDVCNRDDMYKAQKSHPERIRDG